MQSDGGDQIGRAGIVEEKAPRAQPPKRPPAFTYEVYVRRLFEMLRASQIPI
jgi:hypothetical protein